MTTSDGGALRRYKVTHSIEVEAALEDFGAAALTAQRLWDAKGVEAHNERARRHSCLTVELIEDEAER